MSFDFSTLHDKDFEELVRDLLNYRERDKGQFFESFKVGRDSGIDLRHSNAVNGELIIVQAKHYFKSGWNKLYSHLQNEELPKVKRLNPSRYMIATSVPLSPDNKERLKSLFSPFIRETIDIMAADDLNALLVLYPSVRKQHYKLWFTGTDVIESIIQNGIKGRSEFQQSEINKFYSLYVPMPDAQEAQEVLEKNRYIILSGPPGVGKTTMARLLIYNYLSQGYRLVCINDDIIEGEGAWSESEAQLFWFDDCFGANFLELTHGRNVGNAFARFIDRIKMSSNKLLILTSRITILNQAEVRYEALRQAAIRLAEHEVRIEGMERFQRAQLLYNHLWCGGLPSQYKEALTSKNAFLEIIDHPNFSPRLISLVTNSAQIERAGVTADDYVDYVMHHFEYPLEIWKNSYHDHLNDNERFLLQTLFSMSDKYVPERSLKEGYKVRIGIETSQNNHVPVSDGFNAAAKTLRGGFLECGWEESLEETIYKLAQPSLGDFLGHLIANSDTDFDRILKSVTHGNQFLRLFNMFPDSIPKTQHERQELLKYLHTKITGGLKDVHPFPHEFAVIHKLEACWIYIGAFTPEEAFKFCIPWLEEKLEHKNGIEDFVWLADIMLWASYWDESKKWFIERWERFIFQLLDWISGMSIEESFRILKLFDIYEMDYRNYYLKAENSINIRSYVDSWIEDWNIGVVTSQAQHILDESDIERYETKLYHTISRLYEHFIIDATDIDVEVKVKKCMEEHNWQHEMEKQKKKYYRREDGFLREINQEFQRGVKEEEDIIKLFK